MSKISWDAKRVMGLVMVAMGLFLKWWEAANGIPLPVLEVPGMGAHSLADWWLNGGTVLGGGLGVVDAVVRRAKDHYLPAKVPVEGQPAELAAAPRRPR